jgi:nicotinamide phosphoribosyltransferase
MKNQLKDGIPEKLTEDDIQERQQAINELNKIPTKYMKDNVVLPHRQIHDVPRLLRADAYTVGSNKFQSKEAKEKSIYYITFRRQLHTVNPILYAEGDDRIVFEGLGRRLEKLFYEPVTHEEIDEAKRFLSTFKATTKGFTNYEFPEEMWRRVVDEFNGRPPIKITAMPEGSVVYPNEPIIQIESMVDGMGELAAWFESTLLKTWASSERITQNQHWIDKLKGMIRGIDPELDEDTVHFQASLMLTDFGDRAGITNEESVELGMVQLYTFGGTDTVSGAYQAWKNANEVTVGSSVNALAHRNVQAYELENDTYEAIYNSCGDNEIISMVADCYDFYHAVKEYLLPLAQRSVTEGNGKVVVARPDSGNPLEQVLWVCKLAKRYGLYETKVIDGVEWYYGTTLKFIEGDGMDYETMWKIIEALEYEGFAPHGWGLFGVGGGLRNGLKRDNLSAKYALASKGNDNEGVVKFSETLGKTTLPGPFKVLRDPISMENKETIVFYNETGDNAMVIYFDGSQIHKPFGEGMDDNFLDVRTRIRTQWSTMPLSLVKNGDKFPISDAIRTKRLELLKKYAPKKNAKNY